MTFLSVIFILLVCVALRYVWTYYRRIFAVKNESILPGPQSIPKNFLTGNPDELLALLSLLGRIYPSPFKIPVTIKPFVVVYEPNQITNILQSQHCLEKGVLYKYTKQIVGLELITAPESLWKQKRKIIAPSFSPNILQGFFDVFVEESLILADELQQVGGNGNQITFIKHIKTRAFDIACSTMIGVKMESNKKDKCLEAEKRLKEIVAYRLYLTTRNYMLFFNAIFNLTALGREQQKNIKSRNDLFNEIIQQQQDELYKMRTPKTKNKKSRSTFFDNLMEAFQKENFTDKIIRNNLSTIVTKASDTISVTVDFALFMLANFPEIQKKVYKELAEIYGTKTPTTAPVKYHDLQQMNYLDRVIKETMRLFPTIPVIGRQLAKDMDIGDFILPKDTNVIIAYILINRKESYWPDPLKFDPDRFLPEKIKDCSSYYYIPFSDGLRDCIGAKYAMISIKVILATLVRTFVFKVDSNIQISNIKLKMNGTLSTIKPLKVRIEKRNL